MSEITVVVPCYNAESYLLHCLNTLLRQTMPVEIIVVNDGSTDLTGALALDYAGQHDNVHVVNQDNVGSGLARKAGLHLVQTPYVGFVDVDDWIEADMYQKMAAVLKRCHADVVCCGMMLDWPDRAEKKLQSYETGTVLATEQALQSLHRREAVFQYLSNKVYKTELFSDVVIREHNYIGEDYAVTVQLLEKAQRVAILNEPLYHYVQTESSMSRCGFKPQHRLGYQIYKEENALLKQRYPAIGRDIDNYMETEYLAALAAMGRSGTYDHDMEREIMKFVRGNLPGYIKARYVETRFKVSALAAAVHPRVMTTLYRMIAERN